MIKRNLILKKILFYNPDLFFVDKKQNIVIMESSSTGDRKVHIAELIQFITYLINEKHLIKSAILVIFLCGTSASSPDVDNEKLRLKYYFDRLSLSNKIKKKITGIYLTDNSEIQTWTIDEIKKLECIF